MTLPNIIEMIATMQYGCVQIGYNQYESTVTVYISFFNIVYICCAIIPPSTKNHKSS